jgi:hypothetical protein
MAEAKGQRTDLNGPKKQLPVQTPPSGQYGQSAKLRRAQQAVPMGASPVEIQARQAPRIQPGDLTPLTAPSLRPLEPVTAGANVGPGPSAFAAGIPSAYNQKAAAIAELREIAKIAPTDDLLDLLDKYGDAY